MTACAFFTTLGWLTGGPPPPPPQLPIAEKGRAGGPQSLLNLGYLRTEKYNSFLGS